MCEWARGGWRFEAAVSIGEKKGKKEKKKTG
jgi:hypothetical protein